METGARARGLASWAREPALGDGVSGCWVAAAKVPGASTRMTARSVSMGTQCASARCAILFGSAAIQNPRIPLKPDAMFLLISSFSAVLGWRCEFANQEIGVPRDARCADDDSRVTTQQSRS
jgi:hypothetical protein